MQIKTNLWTSELNIEYYGNNKDYKCLIDIIESLKEEEKLYSRFLNDKVEIKPNSRLANYLKYDHIKEDELNSFCNYDDKFDVTGLLKGYALSVFRVYFAGNHEKYLINFGGDILAKGWDKTELIIESDENTKTPTGVILFDDFCVFTSSNKSKRGYHIKNKDGHQLTVTIYSKDIKDLIRMDMYATQLVSGKVTIRPPKGEIIYT